MKTIAGLAAATVSAAALLAGGGAQAEARPVSYVGKTSSGHQVTFKVDGNRMHDLRAGIRTSCVAIQGGGAPNGGADLFGFDGDVPLTGHSRFAFKTKNYLFWGDVTKTHDMWVKRRGNVISGRLRMQFSYMVPSYTPGVFSIYSCLGGAEFTARPR
jgi:hypothetical protein